VPPLLGAAEVRLGPADAAQLVWSATDQAGLRAGLGP